MNKILCSGCGKYLFDTDKPGGAMLAEAQRLGFTAKMPFLYGISGCFVFCDKECHKAWSEKYISSEDKKEGDKEMVRLRNKMPEMIESTSNAMNTFCKALNKLKI